VRDIIPLLELFLSLTCGALGLLLLFGKIRIEWVRRPQIEEPENDTALANYVRPLEKPKPTTLVEGAQKRKRGRPRKVRPASTLIPPAA
jgi:hypothetical protein